MLRPAPAFPSPTPAGFLVHLHAPISMGLFGRGVRARAGRAGLGRLVGAPRGGAGGSPAGEGDAVDAVRAAVAEEAARCHALIDERRREALEAADATRAAAVQTFLAELSELVGEELLALADAEADAPAARGTGSILG